MKIHAKVIIPIVCIFFTCNIFSQSSESLLRDFAKGNINEKIAIANSANSEGIAQSELWEAGFNFVNTHYTLLSDDSDFISLARTLVQKSSVNDIDRLLPHLKELFSLAQNPALVLDLLTVFSSITGKTDEIVAMVNEYAQNLLDLGANADKDMLYLTIEVLGNFADASSFPVLFQAYTDGSEAGTSDIAFKSLSSLDGGSENYIRSLIENGTTSEKYYTLLLVLQNSKNSDFFRAEMSEKSLSSTIINIGDVSTVDDYTIALQMEAIRELQRISWTRSANLIKDYYLVAKKQFEVGRLPDESFVEVIQAFTALSSGNAGQYLTEFLEELNKLQEENKAYSKPVALAVIQSLGLLGDKIAFDALLYTTYLSYPEDIILAARDALVTLKW